MQVYFCTFYWYFTLSYKNEFVRKCLHICQCYFLFRNIDSDICDKVDKFGEKPVLLILLIFLAVLVLKDFSLLIYLSTIEH